MRLHLISKPFINAFTPFEQIHLPGVNMNELEKTLVPVRAPCLSPVKKLHAKPVSALIWKSVGWPVINRCWTLEPCIKTRIHKNEKKNSIEINIGNVKKLKKRHERKLKTVIHEDAVEWRDSRTGHIFKTYQQIDWKIIVLLLQTFGVPEL